MICLISLYGLHGGATVGTSLNPGSPGGPFSVELACCPRGCVGSLGTPASSHCQKAMALRQLG